METSALPELRLSVEALEAEAADGVDAKLVARIANLRHAITEVRNTAQSKRDLEQANALLARLKSVYAP